ADSLLAYLREQRSGYNPVFRDSVHQHTDGILVDHPTRSGEFIPVSGGWADASDYLQYGATTAHATTMLLLAYREHPAAFSDRYQANGLPGANGIPDVLDEARWGLAWLLEMYPEDELLLNQLGDDRDHAFWDLPVHDSADYGGGAVRADARGAVSDGGTPVRGARAGDAVDGAGHCAPLSMVSVAQQRPLRDLARGTRQRAAARGRVLRPRSGGGRAPRG